MQWIEAAFRSSPEDIDALCERLTALGAEGLVIEDEADFRRFLEQNRQYWDYVDEELESRYRGVSRVKLYVEDTPEGRAQLAAFTDGTGLEPECRTVADEDWAESWKQYYKPIEIGERLLILPSWESIPEAPERLVLRLDPGLAFGTGGHATTRMCLEALEKYAGPEKFVLDLGCGSGILGIGALVLGCAYCAGCDVDPKSPESAAANAKLNGIRESIYKMYTGDVLADAPLRAELGAGYDIVLANIVSDVIIPLAPLVPGLMSKKGVFITSGIIDGREAEVSRALEAAGFEITEHLHQAEWHAFVCKLA